MAFRVAAAAFFLCWSFWTAQTKIYDRCELAHELRDVHEFPEHQLATWLCIANYESHFNTSAHNPGSGDHGIFQISELYWCSPPGDGFACGLPCAALKDDDIEDDAVCARRIYRQHQRLSGDGFTAWVVYNLHCKNPAHAAAFLQGCFDEENLVKYGYQPIYEAMNLPTIRVPMPTVPPSPSATPPVSSPAPFSPSTEPPPRKTSTPYPKVHKVPLKPLTTPKPQISTYKPLLNLSTRFASSYKPLPPIFEASPMMKVKPSAPSLINKLPTVKPQMATFQTLFGTTPKPKIFKASTYKPLSSTFGVFPGISVKSSPFQRPTKISPYKPAPFTFRTTPAATFKVTTPRPELSTYKPFLNRLPSAFQRVTPNEISFVTTPRPFGISTYKPFLHQFSTGYKPHIYGLTTPKQVSSFAGSSGFGSSPFTSSALFINNNDGPGKATVVKPRETKNVLPFTLKSGVKPFEFKQNETIFAFVSNPGYSFAISSNGFKFLRTAE